MSIKHERTAVRHNTNKESVFNKRYVRGALATIAAAGIGAGASAYAVDQYEANTTPIETTVEESYGIDSVTQSALLEIQEKWDHDTAPMALHEIPASILRESGFVNLTIEGGAGGAGEQAKVAYANLYGVDVASLSTPIKDSIEITAQNYPRVHEGDELTVIELSRTDNSDEKYAIVTDRVELDKS